LSISTAPGSGALPFGRVTPRWSVASPVVAASRTGLLFAGSFVRVLPPLEANAPSSGKTGAAIVPTRRPVGKVASTPS
jgi:hypothetical protein